MTHWINLPDPNIVEEVGQRLRRLRLNRNKTQQWLADQAGLSRVTISNVENGTVAVSLLSFVRILRALDALHIFNALPEQDAINPIQFAKLMAKARKGASPNKPPPKRPPSEW